MYIKERYRVYFDRFAMQALNNLPYSQPSSAVCHSHIFYLEPDPQLNTLRSHGIKFIAPYALPHEHNLPTT